MAIKDTEAQAKKIAEVEDLSKVDVSLPDAGILDIAASERFNMAKAYQVLATRLVAIKASVKANTNVGNTKAVDYFKDQQAEVERDMYHALRGIKELDALHPKAKARMLELIK